MSQAAHDRYLDRTVEALGLELVAARVNGSAPVMLEGGERLDADALGATYRFTLIYDSALPEGVPVQLEVASRKWDAEVLQREGLTLLLLVRRDKRGELPETSLPSAMLHADPWYLIEVLQQAVIELRSSSSRTRPVEHLIDLLCGESSADQGPASAPQVDGLNTEQCEALAACAESPVWFVWGPPGTGKTRTLGHVVHAAVDAGERVLVSAHSNVAVDAALVAAVQAGVAGGSKVVVRAGPAVLKAARETGLSTRELAFARRTSLKTKLDEINAKLSSSSGRGLASTIERWRKLMAELRELEEEILRTADVVFATLSKTVISDTIRARPFGLAIVDEVSMSYPAQVSVVAALARDRLNVFGDCRQLPPIVQSEAEFAKQLLGNDVFTACKVDQIAAPGVTMLREQWRMHPDIRKVVSDFAYQRQLRDAPGLLEERQELADQVPYEGAAVVWCDVGALGATRFFDRHRGSRFNPVSALACLSIVAEARRSFERVVVLTPYRTQARLHAALIGDAGLDGVEVGTIHRYQGSEAPVVIVDLVDLSGTKVGQPFKGAAGERLLTVGLSRAQGKLVVVGASSMPTVDLSRRSVNALASVRQSKKAIVERPTVVHGADGFTASFQRGVPSGVTSIGVDDVAAAWFPLPIPKALRHLDGAPAAPWEGGHAGWVTTRGEVGLHAEGGAEGTTFRLSKAPRFAEALSDAVTGAPLTRGAARRAAAGEAPPRVVRHDLCGRCGGAALPGSATRYSVELECSKCHGTRRASDREIQAWLRQVGPRCPKCRSGMRLISGPRAPHGPFFGCSKYPDCDGLLRLDDLITAAMNPDPPPPEPEVSNKRSTTKKPAVSNLDRRTCESCFLSKSSALFDEGSAICRDCS
jgi:AAA domain